MSHIVYGLLMAAHVLFALFLIVIILLQGGQGSLGEVMGGAAAQSLFGGSANTVMTKTTAVVAGLFMVTCLSLAKLSTLRGGSVVDQLPVSAEQLPQILPKSPTSSATPHPSAASGAGSAASSTGQPAAPAPAGPPPSTSPASTENTP